MRLVARGNGIRDGDDDGAWLSDTMFARNPWLSSTVDIWVIRRMEDWMMTRWDEESHGGLA